MTIFTFYVIRLLILSAISAVLSFIWAPFLIKILRRIKFWKKTARTRTITNEEAKVFHSLHKDNETSVPRGGGVLIWSSVLIIVFLFFGLSYFKDPWWLKNINFLSRSETWLPLFTLVAGSIVGLTDDALTVFGKGKYAGGGMSFLRRLMIVVLIGLVGSLWFYFKLSKSTIHIPLIYNFPEGINFFIDWWYIPLFILVMLASWSGGVIDGIDGLAGGIFASIFAGFSVIAFTQGKADLATFCAIIAGTLFSFLWFNIPPAKFYMGETGVLGLTSTMTVVAFLTDSIIVLPIIAGIMVIEVGSILIQLFSKKFFKKKVWLCTPIHHHFEAKGWPPYKVTMRFWILNLVFVFLGVAIKLFTG